MSLVQPSGDMSVKIREELREPDADTVAKDIAAIREWLDKQPHLPKDMGMNMTHFFIAAKSINTDTFHYRRPTSHDILAWLQV